MDNFDYKKYLAEGRIHLNEAENEKMSEEEILKKLEQGLKQGLGAAKALENEPVSKKDKELNEGVVTIAALIIGAPGLIKLLSKISEGIGWLFGLGGGDGNVISRALGKLSHYLHKKYIEGISIGLKKAYPSKYDKDKDGKVDGDMAEKLKKDATKAYAGILIAAAIATGISAATAASSVVAALKSAEVVVDIADVIVIGKALATKA